MTKSSLLARDARYGQKVNELLAEMEPLPDETLNRRPVNGGWSAIQTMHHLILTEELSMAYVKKKLSFNPDLEPMGFGARWRGFLLWLYLNTPFKFKAPKNVAEEQLPECSSLAETRARWQKARTEWAAFFAAMPDDMEKKAIYKHPRAGRLGWPQMMAFFETHFARHLKQIRRVLKSEK